MKYAAELWASVLGIGLVISLPVAVPALIWGTAGAIAGGIFWATVIFTFLTLIYVVEMKDLEEDE